MTDYYNSIYSGAQIDEGVGRALSGSAGINRNLLDNWYFGNPVDQRGGWVCPPNISYYDVWGGAVTGKTEQYYVSTPTPGGYSDQYQITVNGAVKYVVKAHQRRGYTGEGYTIDRWRTHGNATVTIGSDSLAFFASGDANIVQPLENALKEDTLLTFSVLNKTGTVYIRIRDTEWGDYGVSQRTGDGVVAVTGTIPKGKIPMVQIYSSQGENIAVKAAKLELGTQQTLAHQDENGNWVLNEIPSYAEELAKCQRHQVVLGGLNRYRTITVGADTLDFFVPTPVPMRAAPMLVGVTSTIYNWANNAVSTGFTLSVIAKADSGVYIRATKSAHGLTDARMDIPAGAILDANL